MHTINNANPYQGITVTKEHGKYPVIFEPLQNVQTSRSTYKVTSFIDFTPYLEYFQHLKNTWRPSRLPYKLSKTTQSYKNFESKRWLPLIKEQEKRVDTIQSAIHNPCCSNKNGTAGSPSPTTGARHAVWPAICRLV